MEYRLNDDELSLLTYLHEHAEGFGPEYLFDASAAMAGTGMGGGAYVRASTYLDGWGLIGRGVGQTRAHDPLFLYLTAHGEAYMRELEHQLEEKNLLARGQRLGLGLLAGMKEAAIQVATAVLTQFVTRSAGPGQG